MMMGIVLPWFAVLSASCSVGLMEAATSRARTVSGTTLSTWARAWPTCRRFARTWRACALHGPGALLNDTIAAIEDGRNDSMLRVLEIKAAAAEAATRGAQMAMRVCGGAAFRKEVGVERLFRDARAASVMGPTTDVLYDFIGKAISGLPLF